MKQIPQMQSDSAEYCLSSASLDFSEQGYQLFGTLQVWSACAVLAVKDAMKKGKYIVLERTKFITVSYVAISRN